MSRQGSFLELNVPQCWIGLGGNADDGAVLFAAMADRLHRRFGGSVCLSSRYRTAAVGKDAGPPYWNAVAGFETDLPPLALLHQLQCWEQEFGRERTVIWGPRTLDLDLLFYGDEVIRSPELTVPHSGAWYRRFVLEPLYEVAPTMVHPEWQLSIEQLWKRLSAPPATLWLYAEDAAAGWQERLQSRLGSVRIVISPGCGPEPHGLLAAIAAASPRGWHHTPHLRFDPQRPREELEQALYDACTAAFDQPVAWPVDPPRSSAQETKPSGEITGG